MLIFSAALLGSAVPARGALVLEPHTCKHPYRSGESLYLSQRSYLDRDAQLAKQARQRFGIDESAALYALQTRYAALKLDGLRTRVIRCTVYFEASSRNRRYLFDAETLKRVDAEERQ
jgi:hypothetical protein